MHLVRAGLTWTDEVVWYEVGTRRRSPGWTRRRGHVAEKRSIHGRDTIGSTVEYVRQGRRNNFEGSAPHAS